MAAGDAFAWSRFHDHIYADSFGNLVVQSPNGYKRIVVGQGHLAKKLSRYEGGGEPAVVYLDETERDRQRPATATAIGRRICGRAAATCTACRTATCRRRPARE